MKFFQLSLVLLLSTCTVAMDNQTTEHMLLREQKSENEFVTCAISPDRSYIAHNHNKLNTIELESLANISTTTFEFDDDIKYLEFSPDSKKLVALSLVGDIAIYSTECAKLLKKNKLNSYHWHGCFSKPRFNKDATKVGGKCANAFIWDIDNNSIEEITCPEDVSKTAVARFNRSLRKLAYMLESLEIRILDVQDKHYKKIVLDKNPKSELLVTGFEFCSNKLIIKHNNGIRVFNMEGDILFDKEISDFSRLLFSYYPKKSQLAVALDKTITVYKVAKKQGEPETIKSGAILTKTTNAQAIDYNGSDIAIRTKLNGLFLQQLDNKELKLYKKFLIDESAR